MICRAGGHQAEAVSGRQDGGVSTLLHMRRGPQGTPRVMQRASSAGRRAISPWTAALQRTSRATRSREEIMPLPPGQ
eukprot:919325-Rhodomonas_salina.2